MARAICPVVIVALVASPLAGCATKAGPRLLGETSSSESDWSRVGQLLPAAPVDVTVRGQRSVSRYFVAADASSIVVLNLTGPMPSAAPRALRDLAALHPDYLVRAREAGVFEQADVRVGRDGVFVAGRRIADLDQVVETIPRGNVTEIWGPVVARGSVVGTFLGGLIGFSVGVVPGLGGASAGVAWLIVVTSTLVGGSLGFRWSSHETAGLIYCAP